MILISESLQGILSILNSTNSRRKPFEKCRIKLFGKHSDFRYQQSDSVHFLNLFFVTLKINHLVFFPGRVMSEISYIPQKYKISKVKN